MNIFIKKIMIFILYPYLVLHIFMFIFSKNKNIIKSDLIIWSNRFNYEGSSTKCLVYLLIFKKEFRNLFYFRNKYSNPFLVFISKILLPRLENLYIPTNNIGESFFIEHGFSTIIAAKEIGKSFKVYQQVTIGYFEDKAPIIGNNVTVYPGAKVIGGITIGDNVNIGANAVVVKDVPANCTVVGVPAYIVKQNGKKVNIKL